MRDAPEFIIPHRANVEYNNDADLLQIITMSWAWGSREGAARA